jgi:hypothetical protein
VSGAMPTANPLPIGTRTHVRRKFGILGAMCPAREFTKRDGVIVLGDRNDAPRRCGPNHANRARPEVGLRRACEIFCRYGLFGSAWRSRTKLASPARIRTMPVPRAFAHSESPFGAPRTPIPQSRATGQG